MIARSARFLAELEAVHRAQPDPPFRALVEVLNPEDDDQLAELVEADGRFRLRSGRNVTLDRYLADVPDLVTRILPLDAAIDMSIRAIARSGRCDQETVERLVREHPEVAGAIRDAASLNNAMWSTNTMVHGERRPPIQLPTPFGPLIETPQGKEQRYMLQELLGEGAHGEVYLAQDRKFSELDRAARVAIKVLSAGDEADDDMLVGEARKARRVLHENVVGIYDYDRDITKRRYVAYVYVPGGDLARWRRSGAASLRSSVEQLIEIARGVQAAHMAGVVHCDLKPNNILIDEEGTPKITDFGVAAHVNTRGESPVSNSVRLGNVAFMSPEQYRLESGALTIPTDIYALGGMLYWLLTGALPNGATHEEIAATHAIEGGRPTAPSARALNKEVDRDLDLVCQRALDPQPRNRHASAAALADDLQAWLEHQPLRWTRPTASHRLGLSIRRSPARAVAVALLILATLSATFFAIQSSFLRAKAAEANVQRSIEEENAKVSELMRQFEEERRRESEEKQETARNRVQKAGLDVKEAALMQLSTQVLEHLWALEYIMGPVFFGVDLDTTPLWDTRRVVIERLLARAEATGGEDSFYAMSWRSAVGSLELSMGNGAVARGHFTRAAANARDVFGEADPFVLDLEALETCAHIDELSRQLGGDPIANRVTLAPHVETLTGHVARLEESNPGSAIHRTVLAYLALLHQPGLLDDAETAKRFLRDSDEHRFVAGKR